MTSVNPRIDIYLDKIEANARLVVEMAKKQGIEITGVTKVYGGLPEIVEAEVHGGIVRIADSRLENLKQIKKNGFKQKTVLLRLPMLSQAEDVIKYADISLNSEVEVMRVLSDVAVVSNRIHRVILMVEMGDLREGILPEDLEGIVEKVISFPNLEVVGIGANFSCYGGVVPTRDKLEMIIGLAEKIRKRFGLELPIVHGGNSSTLRALMDSNIPVGITNLSLGEGILLGRETINREPIPGAYQDAFILSAEIIELKTKPSVPYGTIGQDSFGNVPTYEDRGVIKRAILAIGRQDIYPDSLEPLEKGIDILGASSDHLLLDVTKCRRQLKVGDEIRFNMGYSSLLHAMTSKYVHKNFISGSASHQ